MHKTSPQTLTEEDRRRVAAWAADCAEHAVEIFESERPHDMRPRELIARTRAYARGELSTADEIRRRFVGGVGSKEVESPAAYSAARSAGQAAAVCHMGAHGIAAAAYAINAMSLDSKNQDEAVQKEIDWQVTRMTPEVLAALRSLPKAGENLSGLLRPGLLTTGRIGEIVRKLQARIDS